MLHRIKIDAFTLAPETAEAALGLKNVPKFTRNQINHHTGGLTAAVHHYADRPSSDIILVEDDGNIDELSKRLEALALVVEPGRKLIVIGAVNDIGFYRRMLSLGVAEYLVSPASINDILTAIEHITHDPRGASKARLLSFLGARGGVGSSTIAQSVAWSLAHRHNQRTILIDLDLTFGTAALAFNEEPRQPLIEALADPQRLDQILLQRFMVGGDDRLQILSTNGAIRLAAPPSLAAVEKLVDLSRQMADMVVLDFPHQWSPWLEDLLILSDEVALVAILDLANLRDAKYLLDLLRVKRGENRDPRLIINKSDMVKRSRLTLQDVAKALPVKPSVTIPFDPLAFVEAINEGKTLTEKAKTHKAATAMHLLAADLAGLKIQPMRRSFALPSLLKRQSVKSAGV